jgi:AcrR family transcriptional regulator
MSRREDNKRARRQRIFDAAMELFVRQGFDATTVEEIATAADIAKGTFFNYFATKEAVLGHMAHSQVERLRAALAARPDFAAMSALQQIRTIYQALAAGLEGRGELMRVLAAETLLRPPAFDEHQSLVRDNLDLLLGEAAQRGQEQGELRDDISASDLGRHLRNIYFLAALDWMDQGGRLSDLLDQQLELALAGLTPRISS